MGKDPIEPGENFYTINMIKTLKTTIENVKAEIDEYLYSNSVNFNYKSNTNELGETYFIYMNDIEQIGIVTIINGKFAATVSDNGKINGAKQEGFTDGEIDTEHPIWIDCETIEKFLEKFIPRKNLPEKSTKN